MEETLRANAERPLFSGTAVSVSVSRRESLWLTLSWIPLIARCPGGAPSRIHLLLYRAREHAVTSRPTIHATCRHHSRTPRGVFKVDLVLSPD